MASTTNDASVRDPNIPEGPIRAPIVSFVVLCYKLAHLLPECVNSILAQNYTDFEVLIMDDSSPDNTAEVAKSFQDPRVIHIRNDRNLGFLGNENAGVRLSRGKYVWIISADDYLRRPYVLERYVHLMEKHPNVGYTFCPGVTVENGRETGIVGGYGTRDRVVNGHVFLKTLVHGDRVVAPSALARRECYDKISLFPENITWAGLSVDFSWAGDWYLWCLFALSFDVGYFAEPMVCYRQHDLSMTSSITREENVRACAAADLAVLWLVRQKAFQCGSTKVAKYCLHGVAYQYAAHRVSKRYRSGVSTMSVEEFEESLCRATDSETERNWVRARALEAMGDRFFWLGDLATAKKHYVLGLQVDRRMVRARLKLLLLMLGTPGRYARRIVFAIRNLRTI
jgi:glycosyltransferase involved in cell wall biosynthesis